MAVALSGALENALLDLINGVTTSPPVQLPLRAALLSEVGAVNVAPTEVTGGGYSRQVITFGFASFKQAKQAADAVFANMPTVTVKGVAVYDSSSTPKLLWKTTLGSYAVTSGDTFTLSSTDNVLDLAAIRSVIAQMIQPGNGLSKSVNAQGDQVTLTGVVAAPASVLKLASPNGTVYDFTADNDGSPVTTAGTGTGAAELRLKSPNGKTWRYTVANDGTLTFSEVV